MRERRLAKTANRSVVGIMNEFAFLASAYRQDTPAPDLLALAIRLAGMPCGPLYSKARQSRPRTCRTAALLHIARKLTSSRDRMPITAEADVRLTYPHQVSCCSCGRGHYAIPAFFAYVRICRPTLQWLRTR
jgi:uncharacterized protein DUF6933